MLALAASGRPVRPEGEGARSGARGRGGAGKGRLCSCSALRACLGARHAVRLCWTEEDPWYESRGKAERAARRLPGPAGRTSDVRGQICALHSLLFSLFFF